MNNILIRCSSLGKIMTEPTAAATKKGEVLSVGAKTYLVSLAKEYVYDFREEVSSKYMEKGKAVEEDSINLYNAVFFRDLKKNTERRDNGLITGECDLIIPEKKGIDIKSSWSLATFPVLTEDCHEKDYEMQARGYMMLWDVPEWEIAYCMVDTPPELMRYEQPELHQVSHIDPQMRVTTISYRRDADIEEAIKNKVVAAQKFIAATIERIRVIHGAVETV